MRISVLLLAFGLAGCLAFEKRPPCYEEDDCFDDENCVDEQCVNDAGEGEGEGE